MYVQPHHHAAIERHLAERREAAALVRWQRAQQRVSQRRASMRTGAPAPRPPLHQPVAPREVEELVVTAPAAAERELEHAGSA